MKTIKLSLMLLAAILYTNSKAMEQRGVKRPAPEEEISELEEQKKLKTENFIILTNNHVYVKVNKVAVSLFHTIDALINMSDFTESSIGIIQLPMLEDDTLGFIATFLNHIISSSTKITKEILPSLFPIMAGTKNYLPLDVETELNKGIANLSLIYGYIPSWQKLATLQRIMNLQSVVYIDAALQESKTISFFDNSQRVGPTATKQPAFIDLLLAINFLQPTEVVLPIVIGLVAIEINKKKIPSEKLKEIRKNLPLLDIVYQEIPRQYFLLYGCQGTISQSDLKDQEMCKLNTRNTRNKIREFLIDAFGYEWGFSLEELQKNSTCIDNKPDSVGKVHLENWALNSLEGINLVGSNRSENRFYFDNNNLTVLKEQDQASYTGIYLSGNPLTYIAKGFFPKNVVIIDLKDTLFTSVASAAEISKANQDDSTLNLHESSNLDSSIFDGLHDLEAIYLSSNKSLKLIGDSFLRAVPSLCLLGFDLRHQQHLLNQHQYRYYAINFIDWDILKKMKNSLVTKAQQKKNKYLIYYFMPQ